MAVAEGKSYFCPLQPDLENAKIYWVDTRRSGRHFKRDLKSWKEREKKISPFEVEVGGFRVHATPLENPKYERSSFHIIRLWDSKDSQYQVDFLIQDTDLYFVAFRRKANRQWEGWFTFKDTEKKVANFLGATTKIKMNLRYPDDRSLVTNGGSPMALKEIFVQFREFQGRVTEGFRRAAYSVMVMFCEVRRLRSLSTEISHRIDNQLPPLPLSEFHFELMGEWGTASGIVLGAYNGKMFELSKALPTRWAEKEHLEARLKYFSCLIGLQGELLLLKFNRRYVRDNDNFEKLLKDPRSAMVPDWDF